VSDCSIVFVPLGIGTAAITPSRTANAKGRADALLLRGDMLLVALASALRTIAAADERGRGRPGQARCVAAHTRAERKAPKMGREW
jgi:hypothetical protein